MYHFQKSFNPSYKNLTHNLDNYTKIILDELIKN
jgi:hypothetical protein